MAMKANTGVIIILNHVLDARILIGKVSLDTAQIATMRETMCAIAVKTRAVPLRIAVEMIVMMDIRILTDVQET